MRTVTTVEEMRRALAPLRGRSAVGLVPTMGALHEGHVALFREARRVCGSVVASLFVNPAQFDDAGDLAAYPEDRARDATIAAAAGVDVLFVPSVDEMYPSGFATWVEPAGVALGLEGDRRPGHFRGVATICLKLFTTVQPEVAFFGQKDAQQVAVIRQLVRDLHLPMDIRVVPTVREADGLAMSSRNTRLSGEERVRAAAMPKALDAGLAAYRAGADPIGAAREALADLDIEYVEVARLDGQDTLLIAAIAGGTRLIDNVPLTPAREEALLTPAREATPR